TLTLDSGSDTITLSGPGPVTLNPGAGSISLTANGGVVTIPRSTITGIRQINFANLTIGSTAKVVLAASSATPNDYSNHANRSVAIIAADRFSIASGGTLDMGDNDLILHYAS